MYNEKFLIDMSKKELIIIIEFMNSEIWRIQRRAAHERRLLLGEAD